MNTLLPKKIRVILGALTFLAVFEFAALGALATPQPAYAVVPVTDAPVLAQLKGKEIKDKIELKWQTVAKMAFFQALLNATTYFFQKVAYDTAVWASTGFQGQNPFAYGDNWYDYLRKEALESVGEFIGSLSQGLNIPGVNLCDPNLSIILKIQLGLQAQYRRPTPKCSWNQIGPLFTSGGAWRQRGVEALRNSGLQFEPGQAPLSVALSLNRQVFTEELKSTNAATNERLDQGAFRPVIDAITGKVETPSAVLKKQFDMLQEQGDDLNKISISGAYSDPSVGMGLVQLVVSTFANTLASKLFDKVAGGFFPLSNLLPGNPLDVELAQPPGSRRDEARQLFASLQTAPIRTIERFDLLGEFTSCPDNPGPMNCVVDEAFATAVRQATAGNPLTLRDALEQSPPLIRGDWPLWPPSALDKNQDANCYRSGFCYSNLVKLRRARIIPVGWELAATRSPAGNPVTLAEAIAGYDNCTEDGTVGDDEATRFCHLIDPNWVLKYPLTQCRQLGPGATLLDPTSDSRAEVCADMPSCNATDDAGNCVGGWGYCTRERNLWRFDGDECPAHAASCRTMKSSGGEQLAILTNTADFGVCSADNAGCRWYSTQPAPADPLEWNVDSRVYLNGRAPECDASAAGCTELVPKAGGVTFNLVRNSSFEEDTRDPPGQPDFWGGIANEYGASAFSGTRAVRFLGAVARLSQRLTVRSNQFYTISFFGKRVGATGAARIELSLRNAAGGTTDLDLDRYFVSAGCTRANTDGVLGNDSIVLSPALTADYARYSCTFTTPATAAYLYLNVSRGAGDVWVDALQLEENEFASAYGNGYSGPGAADRTWLKLPPPDLCTGSDADPALCDAYAQVCAVTDVGCKSYSPASGEPGVTGVARDVDACPAACVGYETFREEPTNFNPNGDYPLYFIPTSATNCSVSNAGCDEFTNLSAGAGAEAREYYTGLRLCEAPVAGDDTATYYTWEGTEAEGFQLRVWLLKQSNLTFTSAATDPTGDRAPCTAYNAQNSTCRDGDGLEDNDVAAGDTEFEPPTSCNEASDIFSNPDCREFYDVNGNIHYRLFSRTILKTTECTDFRKTLALGLDPQASCNNSGGRWQSATNECFYRAHVPTSNSCPASENQCRLYTGNTGRNVELIFEDDFEDGDTVGWTGGVISSESLAATGQSMHKAAAAISMRTEAVGGPAELQGRTLFLSFWARGTAGRNLAVRFENAPLGSGATPSTLRSFSYNDSDTATPTAALTGDWRFYELGPVTVDWNFVAGEDLIIAPGSGADLFIDNIRVRAVSSTFAVIRDSWETPPVCDATPEGAFSPQEMLGCETYRDGGGNEVHLRFFSRLCSPGVVGCEAFFNTHNSTSAYAETWNFTCIRPGRGSGPCSVDPDGAAGPAAAQQVCVVPTGRDRCEFHWDNELVGAVAVLGRFNPVVTFPGTAVTLPYIADTMGTDVDGVGGADPVPMPFFVGPDVAVVPADSTVYVVNDPGKRCRPDATGCEAVGLPTFDQTLATVESFESAYRMNLPDRYNEFLCTNDALFCAAWRDSDNTEWYFKNPQEKTCEWRATGPGGSSGWFKSGGDEPCYDNFVTAGDENGIWGNRAVCSIASACTVLGGCNCPTGAVPSTRQCIVNRGERTCSPYGGWVGTCEEQHNACTEFLDPADTDQNELTGAPRFPTGRPHYVIRNTRLDEEQRVPTERCDGQVSLNAGCVLFNETSDSQLQWNTAATYLKSTANNFGLVSPVNCANPSGGDVQYCYVCGLLADPQFRSSPCVQGSVDLGLGFFESRVNTNDANRVLKVRRDRECAEWLACDQPEEVWDPRTSEWKTVCSSLDVCDESDPSQPGGCRYVIDKPEPEVLDADHYSRRDISWTGKEYSGYSIPGQYPVDELEPVNVGACVLPGVTALDIPGPLVDTDPNVPTDAGDIGCNEDNEDPDDNCDAGQVCVPHFRLGRVLGPCEAEQNASCSVGSCPNGSPCDTALDCGGLACDKIGSEYIGEGRCYSGQCAQPPAGLSPDGTIGNLADSANTQPAQCRIYPEVDSPFPNVVVDALAGESMGWNDVEGDEAFLDTPQSVINGFQNAKLCARDENCECSYQRVSYEGGESRYYSQGNSGVDGLCTSGGNLGMACSNDSECDGIEEGTGDCSKRSKSDRFIGLPGFCLEPDRSQNINGQPDRFACLTWYPVDRIAGSPDLYNQFASASWDVPVSQQWYCAQGSWNSASPPTLENPTLTVEYQHLPAFGELTTSVNTAHQFFGPPWHQDCDPTAENWNATYGCIGDDADTDDGSNPHNHRAAFDDNNCGENDGGQWCIWPQYQCPSSTWGPNTDGHTDERYADTAPGTEHCSVNSDVMGPIGVTNFLGCYEISKGDDDTTGDDWPDLKDTGTGHIRYPWIGPDIYQWQVEEFQVTFGNADSSTDNPCRRFTNETGDSIVGNRIVAGVALPNPPRTVPVFPTSNAENLGSPQATANDGTDTTVAFYPVWGPATTLNDDGTPSAASTLKAMTVIADDSDDQSQFWIERFTIKFWPACYVAAQVGGTGSAAFTDRVVEDNYDYPPLDPVVGGFTREIPFSQWGATQAPDAGPATLIVDQRSRTFGLDGSAIEEDVPAGPPETTDALYRDRDIRTSLLSIRQLFARSNVTQRFDPREGTTHTFSTDISGATSDAHLSWENIYKYVVDSSVGWDDTEIADGGSAGRPQVRAVGQCDIGGRCAELDLEGLTVEGGTEGTISGTRQKRVQARFFAYATKNRLPLSRVVMDWGDQDQIVPVDGSFKNHRGECGDADADFGLTPTSCEDRPFTISHDYRCSRSILEQLDYCLRLDAEPGGRHVGAYQAGGAIGGCREGDACVYVPRVMVVDNWGWCAGDCPDAPGGGGCYDGSQNNDPRADAPSSPRNECEINLPRSGVFAEIDPWVYFNGEIVVEVED